MTCNFYDVLGLHIDTENNYYVIELYKIPYYTDNREHVHNIPPNDIDALTRHYDDFMATYQTETRATYKPMDIFIDGKWINKHLMEKYLFLVDKKIPKHEKLVRVMKVRYRRWNLN